MYIVTELVTFMKSLSERIENIKTAIDESEYIIIGAGAGLSAAAGLEYGGERFLENFSDYITKYQMTDMYTAGFYPFETLEEKWGYWSKHIYLNNIGQDGLPLYKKLYELVKDKKYFVITTNVDDQFVKSGFPSQKVYATQGSYRYLQCSRACHDKLYDDTQIIKEMVENIDENLKIPSELVPFCPKCGEALDTNLRKDNYFVEDTYWHKQHEAYQNFVNEAKNSKTLLLEFGIGYNTPAIIRFPFESMTEKIPEWKLVRFNRSHLEVAVYIHKTWKLLKWEALEKYKLPNNFNDRYIPVSEDIEAVVDELLK